MERYIIKKIGTVKIDGEEIKLILEKEYHTALTGLEEFGYINVLWWFSKSDNNEARTKLVEPSPYAGSQSF